MENILSIAKRTADDADIFLVKAEETPVEFEANALKNIQSKYSNSTSLRIIKDGKIGYANTTEQTADKKLVDMALETARFGMPAQFEFPSAFSYPDIEIYDLDIETISIENMINLGQSLIDSVKKHTPDIVCEATVGKATVSIHIMNSRGGEASYKKSIFYIGVSGTLINGTDMLFVGESQSSCHPLLETKEIISKVINQLELAKNQASVQSKAMPVIFTPHGVAMAFLPPLMAAFNGKIVLEGASPVGDKLGQNIVNDNFSIWDNPTIPYQPQSRICDDEGVPSQQTPLILNGVATNFLYDLHTSAMAGKKSTGNGHRGQGGLLSPSSSALVISTGDTEFEDMVKDIKEGLIVEQLMGAGQGNVLGGNFSGNVLLGYKIENGKIVGRVKDTMVSGNVYQALNQISAIGNKAEWVGGATNTPHLCCHDISVASK